MPRKQIDIRALLFLLVVLASGITVGRAGQPEVCQPIALDLSTQRIEGWFAARADWKVNSTREYATFNPFRKEEDQRCVTVVNDTGAPTEDYAGFNDKRVIITGFALRYHDLPVGDSVADQALTRRYYKGQRVHNFCLRELIFVATKIMLKD